MLAQRRNDERVVELHVERPASDALVGASSMPMMLYPGIQRTCSNLSHS